VNRPNALRSPRLRQDEAGRAANGDRLASLYHDERRRAFFSLPGLGRYRAFVRGGGAAGGADNASPPRSRGVPLVGPSQGPERSARRRVAEPCA